MEFLVYFVGGSVAIIVMILKFEKKQTSRINTVLKENRSVPPLFLAMATEQKINTIKLALHYDGVHLNKAYTNSIVNIYQTPKENVRQNKMLDLKSLAAKYHDGAMSLEAYNAALDDLLEQIHKSDVLVLAS